MKTIRPILLVSCCIALLFTGSFALAENAALPPPAIDDIAGAEVANIKDKPANLQKELAPPTENEVVDIRSYQRKDGATITEYGIRGRVYKIKVQPPGGLPAYYLYDSDGDGRFEQRLPGGNRRIAPPTWVLQEF